MLTVTNAEYRYAEGRYAQDRYAEGRGAATAIVAETCVFAVLYASNYAHVNEP
jgi:hypothetical protein